MRRRLIFTAAGIAIVPLFWWLLHLLVKSPALPGPFDAATHFIATVTDSLWRHALASFARVVVALGIALSVGVPAGIAMGRVIAADWLFTPSVYLWYPIPKITFLPVILVIMGAGDHSRIALLVLVLVFQVLVAARDGARGIDRRALDVVRSFGAGRLQELRFVVIPAILPRVFTSLRIASATALAVLFFAETWFTRYGLGYFIVDSWMRVSYDDMFAGIVAMSTLGLLLFLAIDVLDRTLCFWTRVK